MATHTEKLVEVQDKHMYNGAFGSYEAVLSLHMIFESEIVGSGKQLRRFEFTQALSSSAHISPLLNRGLTQGSVGHAHPAVASKLAEIIAPYSMGAS